MFDFARLDEIVTDPREFASPVNPGKRRQFVEITKDTPLTTLSKFFEWNSAAVVTEKSEEGSKSLSKPIAVVTKVDLLTWMINKKL
jgi:cystathionine beta-synthase